MADHKAARERCTTFLKEKTEAVDAQDLPVLDECPICLDSYVLEESVSIKVEGCNHVFGRNCLISILTNNPRLEKKCPLCRTVWIEAPSAVFAASAIPVGLPTGSFRFHAPSRHPVWPRNIPTPTNPRQLPYFTVGSGVPPTRPQIRAQLTQRVQPLQQNTTGVISLVDSDDEEDVRMTSVLPVNG